MAKVKALVVYESMFGNSEQVARAVARGLDPTLDVQLVEVAEAPTALAEPVGLLVVGGPTHAFSMSRASTRQEARRQGADRGGVEVGIREWVEQVQPASPTLPFATFDTRVNKVRHLPGSAARAARKALRHRGFRPVDAAQSFYVGDVAGPLLEGELARAQAWGRRLGLAVGGPIDPALFVPSA